MDKIIGVQTGSERNKIRSLDKCFAPPPGNEKFNINIGTPLDKDNVEKSIGIPSGNGKKKRNFGQKLFGQVKRIFR